MNGVLQAPANELWIPNFAFPNDERPPPPLLEGADQASVSFDIRLELGLPELGSGAGRGRPFAPGMSMPETTVNEHSQTMLWQDEIWLARQITTGEAKAQA